MKRITLILFVLVIGLNNLFSQSAYDQVKDYAKQKDYVKAANYIQQAINEKPKDVEFRLLCGDIYMELEKPDSAYIMYKKADDIDGGEVKIMRKVGRSLSFSNRHLEAISILKEAVKKKKDDLYSYLELANAYLKADSVKEAEIQVIKAREINKSVPDAFIALGDIYFKQGVYELAQQNYEQALQLDSKMIDARIKLATSYYWLGQREFDTTLSSEYFARSLKEWNNVTKQDSTNARAFFEQGKILYFSKMFDLAARSLYKYVELRPQGSLGRWYLAQSLYEMSRCDSAAPHLKQCSQEIDSVKSKALLLLGRCYFDNKKYAESIEVYVELKKSGALQSDDQERLATAAWQIQDTVNAITYFKETIEMDQSKCKLMYRFGLILYKMKRYDEAITVFDKRIKSASCADNLVPQVYFFKGVCYMLNKQLDSAMTDFQTCVKLDTNYINAYVYIADIHSQKKEDEQAIEMFNFVIERAAKDTLYKNELTQAFSKLSGIYVDLKKYDDLKKNAIKWSEAFPDNATAYIYLGVGQANSKDKNRDAAIKSLKKALQLDPKSEFAKKYLKSLEAAGGE
jgi:tetratricopeptide (TPR) repeat protein